MSNHNLINEKLTNDIFDVTHENFNCDIYYQEFNKFDWAQYVDNYIDLREANINTLEKAWEHWISYGINENRTFNKLLNNDYNSFDWEQYIKNYPDLKNAGIDTKDKAWFHWFHSGIYEGKTFNNLLVETLNH